MIRQAMRITTTGVVTAALALLLGGPARAATALSRAPEFTLRLLDGSALSLADLKGKPALLNFWWSK